jgi:hypothetical protein
MTKPEHLRVTCREYLPLGPGVGRTCGREAWEIVDDRPRCPTHAATRRALARVARVAPGIGEAAR